MTHIMERANLLVAPFPANIRLGLNNDGWRIAAIESSEGHLNRTLGQADVAPAGYFETKREED